MYKTILFVPNVFFHVFMNYRPIIISSHLVIISSHHDIS